MFPADYPTYWRVIPARIGTSPIEQGPRFTNSARTLGSISVRFSHRVEVYYSHKSTSVSLLDISRCDEIANAASQEFDTEIKNLQESIENGEIAKGLGGIMQARKASALSESRFSTILPID